MTTKLELVSAEDPPVTVEQCKAWCRLFDDSHQLALEVSRDAAIEFIESQLREQLRVRKWQLTATEGEITDGWTFPKWPAIEITSLTVDGVAQDLGDFGIDTQDDPPKLSGTVPGGVQILQWRAGMSTLSAARKLLILQTMADFLNNREASGGAAALSIGTKLLLESENKHIDAVRG